MIIRDSVINKQKQFQNSDMTNREIYKEEQSIYKFSFNL